MSAPGSEPESAPAAAEQAPVRERCLTEATRLFAAHGVAGTSLSTVARAVGVRKPSLLYHFPSKDALRNAVIDEMLDRWREVIPRALTAAAGGKPRFEAIMGEVVRFFAQEPTRARLLTRECLDRPDEMRERLRRQLLPWVGLVTEAIELGQREGRVHEDLDPQAWLSEIVILAAGHFSMQTVSRAIAPLGDGAEAEDPEALAAWEARRTAELLRIAQISLFKPRPAPAAAPAAEEPPA